MPLLRYRIVEIGTGTALAYAGKLFAAFGADSIKIEPPGGDSGRVQAPLIDIGDGRKESAYFAWLNVGKKSVCIDDAAARELIVGADVLLDGRAPGAGADGVLAHAALHAANPALTIVALSWFGENGPYRDYLTTDATCRALAGLTHLIGPVERPVGINDNQADIVGGLSAYIAALTGLFAGGRRMREDEIEAAIEAWTGTRNADDVMRSLQERRIVAGVVRSPYDLHSDPHLLARDFWQRVDRPFCGPHLQASLSFRESDAPYAVRHASPTLGQFNRAVLGEILGLSDSELEHLTETGVIGTEALPPHAPKEKARS